jgi:hypothetical protein
MRLLLLSALLFATPAFAAERTFPVGSFERVRVAGPLKVRIATGAAPGAKARADQPTLDRLSIEVSGGTLTVRMGGAGWSERPALAKATVPEITLSTPRLVAVAISAGAQVETGKVAGNRVDLTITGPGTLAVAGAEADQLIATVVGSGTMTLAGKAATARLSLNGTGAIAAPELTADTAVVRLEGPGEIAAHARYAAQVTSNGLGRVTVTGAPKCTVTATSGGPVSCGVGAGK